MKSKTMTITITVLTLLALLLVSVSGAVAQEPAPPSDEVEAQAADLGTGFTYQGQLKKSGVPYTGTCDFQFSLFDSAGPIGGVQVGATDTVPNVSVSKGLFTARLNVLNEFGANAFNGDARYLRIAVRCPAGSGTYTTLSVGHGARQALTGVPYALGLRPGMRMDGAAYQNLKIQSRAPAGGIPAAVTGEMYVATDGVGVYGSNSVNSVGATGAGVWGRTWSPSGYGVWGTGLNNATGVYGESDWVGVKGKSNGASNGVGVGGTADNGGCTTGLNGCRGVYGYSGKGYGVDGQTNTGVAVHAFANGNGVGLRVDGQIGGNLIEAYHGPLFQNRRFYVSNAGNVYADGSYNCGQLFGCFNTGTGADVAERIDARETLQPGDVVEIDPERPENFRLTRTAYSTLVAGVVSTSPAVTMNNNDLVNNDTGVRTDHRPLLALVGQVPVKVSAENGAIRLGDLLTASSTPGRAMRAGANAPMGSIIGKALGVLDSGTGVIKMLVTLQ